MFSNPIINTVMFASRALNILPALLVLLLIPAPAHLHHDDIIIPPPDRTDATECPDIVPDAAALYQPICGVFVSQATDLREFPTLAELTAYNCKHQTNREREKKHIFRSFAPTLEKETYIIL